MRSNAESGCILPFLQSLGMGVLGGGLVAAVAFWAGFPEYAWIALIVGSGIAFWWFSGSAIIWRRNEYPNPDPVIVQATAPLLTPLQISLGNSIKMFDFPCDPERFRMLSQGLLSGQSFAEDNWTGRDGIFSKSEFRKIRSLLIDQGYAEWRNKDSPSQGCDITPLGIEFFRETLLKM